MLLEVIIESIYHLFLFRVLDHTFLSVYDSDFVAAWHIPVAEDYLPLPDGRFIYKLDTFGCGIYFILTNREDDIELQTAVPSLHVDSGLRG